MKKILWLSIIAYIVFWSALSFWKYDQLLYNGLDLAIYNNVFWNTSHGNWFASSIHPPSYLGDHFEPLILPLSLLYRLWPDARMLLILQSVVLALSAIPLYAITQFLSRRGDSGIALARLYAASASRVPPMRRIAQPHTNESRAGGTSARATSNPLAGPRTRKEWIPLLFGFAWLANPFVHNANLFEFHILTFAPLFLFSMYYFYLQRRFLPFLLFTLLSLAVREDIALLVAAFSVLFFIEWVWSRGRGGTVLRLRDFMRLRKLGVPRPRSDLQSCIRARSDDHRTECSRGGNTVTGPLPFIVSPIILAVLWLPLSFSLISHFSPEGSYKFLAYYSWIQTNPISGFFAHLVKPTVLAMIVGLFIPFLFLPLTRPRFLLLALPPLLQFALTSGGGGSLVLQTHYALLFLPALFLGTVDLIGGLRGGAALMTPQRRSDIPQSGFEGRFGMASPMDIGERNGLSLAVPRWRDENERRGMPREVLRATGPLAKILPALLTTATLYSTLTLGPLLPALKKIFVAPPDQQLLQTKKEFLAKIPKGIPLITTYEFLTPLSNRETVVSLHYAFLGRKQYSEEPYHIPENITTALIDFDDFKTYQLQFARNPFYARFYQDGNGRIRQFIRGRALAPTKTKRGITLFTPLEMESRAEFTTADDASQIETVLAQMHVPEVKGGLELDGIRSIIRIID